jgi:hypothetical protein
MSGHRPEATWLAETLSPAKIEVVTRARRRAPRRLPRRLPRTSLSVNGRTAPVLTVADRFFLPDEQCARSRSRGAVAAIRTSALRLGPIGSSRPRSRALSHRPSTEFPYRSRNLGARRCKGNAIAAAITLYRLLNETGRKDRARMLLQQEYDSFTEGLDSADLKEATALLGDLREAS